MSLRLLLGNAMQGSALLNEIEAVDSDDFPIGEKLADDSQSAFVIFRLPESRDENSVVEDEKIHIGRRQDGKSPTWNLAGLWKMDGYDLIGSSGGSEEIFQPPHISREHGMIGRVFIRILTCKDAGLVGETCEVVDVAIRIIAFDSSL